MNQVWNSDMYARDARFVSELATPVVELLRPKPGERILNLGCGDGALTRQLQDFGCNVVGVDSSPDMVRAAVNLGLNARLVDGEELNFEDEFDAVFSNAVLHWMIRCDDVIAGVYRALKPGGRFVGEFGGHGNIATVISGLSLALENRQLTFDEINPWYFPTPDEYGARLESHSLKVHSCQLIPRPTPLSTDLISWLKVFASKFLSAIPVHEQESFLRQISRHCETDLLDSTGRWNVDYVRLRFYATKA